MIRIICGVDVSSTSLECSIGRDGRAASFANTPEGIQALAAFCQAHAVDLIALEATGGYERLPCQLLAELGLSVALLNPRAVRRFAEGMGLLEKTDTLDARVIAWYAEVKRCQPQLVASAAQLQLRAQVGRLRQLTALRTAQRNQSRLVTEAAVRASFTALLELIEQQIGQLEESIAKLIAKDPFWQRLDQSFRSIKGVANRTVARIMAEMPEIGTLSNKAISKLAGVAPLARDSGKMQGKRSVRGGRSQVREILFIVASVAGRYEPDFMAFQKRLQAAGKPPKVIRIALAHKLLIRLNAKAREVRQQTNPLAEEGATPNLAVA